MGDFNRKPTAQKSKIVLLKETDPPEFSTGDLGKIQEILFGQQLRANSDQLSKLNTEIANRLTQLSESNQRQFTELQTRIDENFESIKLAQNEKDNKYQTTFNTITQQNSSVETSLLANIKEISNSSAHIQQRLQDQLDKSNERQSASLTTTRNELIEMLNSSTTELQALKIDRGTLSQLLSSVATQLSEEKCPGNGSQTVEEPVDSK